MCWSLRVSLVAGVLAEGTALHIWKRNATPRDRWNAIFLCVFGLMQWVDAGLWFLHDIRGEPLGYPCSNAASTINVIGMMIIILEPVSCLLGSMYARGKWWTPTEFFLYVFCNFLFQFFFGYVSPFIYDTQLICESNMQSCPYLTENGHLLLAFGVDSDGGPTCWRQYGFVGAAQKEIPLWLRVAYLAGMVYPYLRYSNPLGSGLIQSFVLTATWLIGFFSDSHASVWCLANVAQTVTMLADPYWFPPRGSGSPIKHKVANCRDLYNKRKVQRPFDVIVCGSGIGGLSCAAILSRAGLRCLVLEAHYRAGGCTHEFTLGNNSFDSGIHYIGGSTVIRTLLSFITDAPGIALAKMGTEADGYCYDEFDLGDSKPNERIKYKAGAESVRKELEEHFPHEKEGIDLYFKRMEEGQQALGSLFVIQMLPEWLLDRFPKLRAGLFKVLEQGTQRTAEEVVAECVSDPKLQALLSAGQLIDWNLQPDKASWSVVGAMSSYYSEGGYYPIGGSKHIAERIIPVIERAGGRVLCRAKIAQLLVDNEPGPHNGRVTGVKLVNGDELFATHAVVSDMGILNTLRTLPDSALEEAKLSREIPGSPPSSNGHMTAFVCLDGSPEQFDLLPANIHSWRGLPEYAYNPSKMQEAFYEDPFSQKDGCLVTLTAPCVKDPEYAREHPNTANVLLLTEGRWDWFKSMNLEEVYAWYNKESDKATGTHGKRPAEYLELKERWKELFLERLYMYFPKTRGHVERIEIGTPVTEAHFINSARGSSYGISWTPARFGENLLSQYLRVKSKIPGLYIAGESALYGGFAGSMAGGYLAALKLLGFRRFISVLLSTESVDAEEEHWRRRHPEVSLQEESNRSMFLSAFVALMGIMFGGKRVGAAVTKAILTKKLD